MCTVRVHYCESDDNMWQCRLAVHVRRTWSHAAGMWCDAGAGINDPLKKIYVTTTKQGYFPVTIFFFAISQFQRLQYSRSVGSFLARRPGVWRGVVTRVGVGCGTMW